MMPRAKVSVTLAALAFLATACPDPNPDPGGGTPGPTPVITRLASGGTISTASISRNGRFVVYVSTATTPGVDHNGSKPDVFIVDRQTSETQRVSGGNAAADSPSVADDGSVVFRSASTDVGSPTAPHHADVFRWTSSGGVVRVTDSPGDVLAPLVSADGTTIVVGGPGNLVETGRPTRTQSFRSEVSAPSTFTMLPPVGTSGSTPVAIDATGSRILLAEPGRLSLFETATSASVLVGSATASPPAPKVTTFAVAPHAIATDGDVVFAEVTYTFDSATGVVSFESGSARRWDRQSSMSSALGTSGAPAGPVQSVDGRYVGYADVSGVSVDQDAGLPFLPGAVRMTDRSNGKKSVVASAPKALFGTMSGDGRYIAFVSTDATLVAGGTPNASAVYLWDRND